MLTVSQVKAIKFLRAIKTEPTGVLKLTAYALDSGESYSHLEQIGIKLRRAGIIKARRGPGGGYMIPPTRKYVTLMEVVSAVSDKKFDKDCEVQKLVTDTLSRVIVA